eukprot:m.361823 g.361823  ORF g.361823 m.361823 type:complete len:51 (+) comp20784_c0_seq2:408-560(+)
MRRYSLVCFAATIYSTSGTVDAKLFRVECSVTTDCSTRKVIVRVIPLKHA